MNHPDREPDAPPVPATGAITTQRVDDVAVLRIDDGSGNRFDAGLIAALSQALGAVLADRAVRGVVIHAGGGDFCAGPPSDLPPPGPDATPLPPGLEAMADLCRKLAEASKPVICALHGRVSAGGLALALAARGRIATPDSQFALTGLRLGRLPPGNAAVRLAWLIGAEGALRLAQGARLSAHEALAVGLVDALEAGDLLAAALLVAGQTADAPRGQPGLRDAVAFRAAIKVARAELPEPLPAHRLPEGWLIDSVEGAQLLPADQALTFDLVREQDAALRPEARARAHVARAVQRAGSLRPLRAEGVIAVALEADLGARLVPSLLRAGLDVAILAPDWPVVSERLNAVRARITEAVQAGDLSRSEAAGDEARLSGLTTPEAIGSVALADPVNAAWLEPSLPPTTPLAVWLDLGDTLPALVHAGHAVAITPAPTRPARLCEVIARGDTPPEALRAVAGLVERLGMLALRVSGGSVVSPLVRTAARTAARLRALGVTPDALASSGILPPGLERGTEARVRADLPLPVERLILLAVANTGARLLQDGLAMRPSDLDLAMVLGAGWPEWRGGPMAEADQIGVMVLRHELRQAAELDPDLWTPEPILDEMLRRGWRFEDLNAG